MLVFQTQQIQNMLLQHIPESLMVTCLTWRNNRFLSLLTDLAMAV